MFEGVALDINLHASAARLDENIADEELVKAVLSGEETAFTLIFERYRRLVVYLASRFFSERDEIEEIVQQSFTKIYFSLKSFRGGNEKSFSSWLSKLTVNVCYDELRRQKRRQAIFFNNYDDFNDEEKDIFSQIAAGGANVEDSLVAADLAEKILSILAPEERVALTLVYSENFSIEEVSETVGWSKSKVKTQLFRCRNKLKQRFGHLFT